MKIIVGLSLALLVFGLIQMGSSPPGQNESNESSSRVRSNRGQTRHRGQNEELAEMARKAAKLSDGELSAELNRSIISWLENVKDLKRPLPLRESLIFAREVGKREGAGSLDLIYDLVFEIEDQLESAGDERKLDHFLAVQEHPVLAAFSGYLERSPKQGAEMFVGQWEKTPKDSPIRGGLRGYEESLEDLFESKMVGEALGVIARDDPEEAFALLKRAQDSVPWNCRRMVADFLKGLPLKDRKVWLERAAEQWPKDASLFRISLKPFTQVQELLENRPMVDRFYLPTFIRDLSPDQFFELAMNEKIDPFFREILATHLFDETKFDLANISSLSDEIQNEVIKSEASRLWAWYENDFLGPVEGVERSRDQNRESRAKSLLEILEKSSVDEREKVEYRERLMDILEEFQD
ncbi:MAG: hypothetical protein PVJ98_09205 [Akkermansiaceae bacterium]|jgi:hypothetical protein